MHQKTQLLNARYSLVFTGTKLTVRSSCIVRFMNESFCLSDLSTSLPKILCSLGNNVGKQLHFHPTNWNIANGDIEKDNWALLSRHGYQHLKRSLGAGWLQVRLALPASTTVTAAAKNHDPTHHPKFISPLNRENRVCIKRTYKNCTKRTRYRVIICPNIEKSAVGTDNKQMRSKKKYIGRSSMSKVCLIDAQVHLHSLVHSKADSNHRSDL
jgi:hypothetical protein